MTDPVIPRAAIVATTEARYAHRDASGPYGAVKCRCGERFRTGVEQLQHASQSILTAALPHLRPLVEAPTTSREPEGKVLAALEKWYAEMDDDDGPFAFNYSSGQLMEASPESLKSLLETATKLGLELGRQEALEELPTPERLAREIHRLQFPTHAYCEPDSVDIRKAARALQALRDTGKGAEG